MAIFNTSNKPIMTPTEIADQALVKIKAKELTEKLERDKRKADELVGLKKMVPAFANEILYQITETAKLGNREYEVSIYIAMTKDIQFVKKLLLNCVYLQFLL